MKNLLSIFLFSLCFSLNAQTSYSIYGTTYGIKNSTPNTIIKSNSSGGYNVYGTTYGIQNATPTAVINSNSNGGYNVYGTVGFYYRVRG